LNSKTARELVAGPAGRLECAIDRPVAAPGGVVVVCHPHPQFGGSLDNKVVQTVSRAFLQVGWASVRFNFRGVGGSEGAWDEGRGEVDDARAVVAASRAMAPFAGRPLALAGFSFGGFVAATVAAALADSEKVRRLVLVAPSTEKQALPAVPADTLVIHGDDDDVVPLAATLAWARPHALPVVVYPGVGHFFHGQLGLLKRTICRDLHDLAAA
jgi:alpha/beta superfamily hydrolase